MYGAFRQVFEHFENQIPGFRKPHAGENPHPFHQVLHTPPQVYPADVLATKDTAVLDEGWERPVVLVVVAKQSGQRRRWKEERQT